MKDIANYILSNIANIGTLLGVCVSIGVLLEMRKQRQQSLQPQLFIKDQHFWLQKNHNGTPCFMKQTPDKCSALYGPSYKLKMENIGVGTAHSIGVYWRYPAKHLIRDLISIGHVTNKLKNDYENHFQYYFGEEEGTLSYGFVLDDNADETKSISYLKSGESIELNIPETIKNYLTFLPYLRLIKDGFPHSIEIQTSDLRIEFTYTDISGRQQHQIVGVYATVYAMGINDPDDNYAIGTLTFGAPQRIRRLAIETRNNAKIDAVRIRNAIVMPPIEGESIG